MVKNLKAGKLKKKLNYNEKVFIKSFPGANVVDMQDYVRPTMRKCPDLIVLHAGTNELRTEKCAKSISSDLMRLALKMKSDNNDVMVSGIIHRGDYLNSKAKEVNVCLKDECDKYNLYFIDHTNITSQHLSSDNLHLNFKGTLALAQNFVQSIII